MVEGDGREAALIGWDSKVVVKMVIKACSRYYSEMGVSSTLRITLTLDSS